MPRGERSSPNVCLIPRIQVDRFDPFGTSHEKFRTLGSLGGPSGCYRSNAAARLFVSELCFHIPLIAPTFEY